MEPSALSQETLRGPEARGWSRPVSVSWGDSGAPYRFSRIKTPLHRLQARNWLCVYWRNVHYTLQHTMNDVKHKPHVCVFLHTVLSFTRLIKSNSISLFVFRDHWWSFTEENMRMISWAEWWINYFTYKTSSFSSALLHLHKTGWIIIALQMFNVV